MLIHLLNIILTYYIIICTGGIMCREIPKLCQLELNNDHNQAINKLQEYIRIDTSRPENLELAVDFWTRQADELGLLYNIYRPAGLPIFVATLQGRKPELPSILLNSHSDVVTAEEEYWTYPPFAGHIDSNCDMYGRGTQDTKGLGIQYIEAIRQLIQNNVTLDRTVHIMVIPDEETGSFRGMVPFIETEEFKAMNVEFALDEGLTTSDNNMYALYMDKRPWQMKFNIQGHGGHGASLENGTVMEQVQTLINLAMKYRKQQMELRSTLTSLTDYGAYSTLNINVIKGGLAANIVPNQMSVIIDVRLAVHENVTDFQSMISSWQSQLSPQSTLEFIRRIDYSAASSIDDSNLYWVAMRNTVTDLGFNVIPIVCPATTDMLYLRKKGISAFGFTSRTNMILRHHDNDEYIPIDNFLRGIDIYKALIKSLANLPEDVSKNHI